MPVSLDHVLRRLLLVGSCALVTLGSTASFAADAAQGKVVAERWCASCHLVARDQKSPTTDQAPPFATIAGKPDFGANKLAMLLLAPHPNMPKLTLSREEVANLADYMATLK